MTHLDVLHLVLGTITMGVGLILLIDVHLVSHPANTDDTSVSAREARWLGIWLFGLGLVIMFFPDVADVVHTYIV